MKFQVLFLPLIRAIIIIIIIINDVNDQQGYCSKIQYDPSQETELSGLPRTMSDPTGCLELLTTSQTKKMIWLRIDQLYDIHRR